MRRLVPHLSASISVREQWSEGRLRRASCAVGPHTVPHPSLLSEEEAAEEEAAAEEEELLLGFI